MFFSSGFGKLHNIFRHSQWFEWIFFKMLKMRKNLHNACFTNKMQNVSILFKQYKKFSYKVQIAF